MRLMLVIKFLVSLPGLYIRGVWMLRRLKKRYPEMPVEDRNRFAYQYASASRGLRKVMRDMRPMSEEERQRVRTSEAEVEAAARRERVFSSPTYKAWKEHVAACSACQTAKQTNAPEAQCEKGIDLANEWIISNAPDLPDEAVRTAMASQAERQAIREQWAKYPAAMVRKWMEGK